MSQSRAALWQLRQRAGSLPCGETWCLHAELLVTPLLEVVFYPLHQEKCLVIIPRSRKIDALLGPRHPRRESGSLLPLLFFPVSYTL